MSHEIPVLRELLVLVGTHAEMERAFERLSPAPVAEA
jgi:hypothetical protein